MLVVVIFLCSYSISCSSSHIDTYQRPFKKNKNRSMCCLPSQKTRPENVSENFCLQWRTAARVEVHVRLFQWHFSRPLDSREKNHAVIPRWFLRTIIVKLRRKYVHLYSLRIIPPAIFFESFEVGITGLCEWVISHFKVQNGKNIATNEPQNNITSNMPFRFPVYAEIKGHLQGNQQNNEYEATAK